MGLNCNESYTLFRLQAVQELTCQVVVVSLTGRRRPHGDSKGQPAALLQDFRRDASWLGRGLI